MLRLALAFTFLLFIGCSKDKYEFSLVGKWKAVAHYNANTAWGGCSCWKDFTSAEQHIVEFNLNGTYKYIPSMLSSFSGCTGDYQETSDSTISWNKCGSDPLTFKISYQAPFLIIEENPAGGPIRIKYKRL